jgi:hypothetical protein
VLRCDFSAAVYVHNRLYRERYTCASRGAATCVICPYTLYPAYIGRQTHLHRGILHPSTHPFIHHPLLLCRKTLGPGFDEPTWDLPCPCSRWIMDATVVKCRTQHLISPNGGTRRCVCCGELAKSMIHIVVPLQRCQASHKDHGSNLAQCIPRGERMCRFGSPALPAS